MVPMSIVPEVLYFFWGRGGLIDLGIFLQFLEILLMGDAIFFLKNSPGL